MPWTSGLLFITNHLLFFCYSVPLPNPKYSNEKLLKSLQKELKFDKSDDLFKIVKADRVAQMSDDTFDNAEIPAEIKDIPGMQNRGLSDFYLFLFLM